MKHVLYTEDEFTPQDIISGESMAVAVVCDGLAVCKVCGEMLEGLELPCLSKEQRGTLFSIWRGAKTGFLPQHIDDLKDAELITSGTLDGFGKISLTEKGRDAVTRFFL